MTKGLVLLEGIPSAAEGYIAHLLAKSVDHNITFTLAVEVRVSMKDT